MSDAKDDIESLIKSAFKAIKGSKPKPLGKTEVFASFGADLDELPGEKTERIEHGGIPVTPEQISTAAEAHKIFPPEMPLEYREDFLTLTNSVGILLGAFVAINVAHDPKLKNNEKQRDKLYATAQGLCRKAAIVMKNLKTVQFSVSRPDDEGNLTIQIVNRKKDD